MQKRLIEEMASLRGGKTKLRVLREEYQTSYNALYEQLGALKSSMELIDQLSETDTDPVSEE